MLSRKYRRALAMTSLASIVLSASACTFPTVDYREDAPPCTAPGGCANGAMKCGDEARKTRFSCEQKCMSPIDTNCTSNCAMAFQTEISQCVAACESCATNASCMNPTASCQSLVGN